MSWGTFWLITGPNGAGKTTLASRNEFARWTREAVRLNADELTLLKRAGTRFQGFEDVPFELLASLFKQAAEEAFEDTELLLESGLPVLEETVLSADK